MRKIENRLFGDIEFDDDEIICKSVLENSLVSQLSKEGIVYIDDGEVEVCSVTLDGTNAVVKTLKKGDIFGIIELFGNTDTDTVLIASKKSNFSIVKKYNVLMRMRSDSEFSFRVIELLNEKIKFLFRRLSCFTTKSAQHRVASLLLSDGKSLPRDEQASVLGISRATLFRELNNFKDQGIIETKGSKIVVKDKSVLQKICMEKQ